MSKILSPTVALMLATALAIPGAVLAAEPAPVLSAAQAALDPAAFGQALVGRVLPGQASRFVCEAIPAEEGRDVFEIEARDGKVVLRGNNGLAIAMAFNWYLRHEAKANFDWFATGPLSLAGDLPVPAGKIRQSCAVQERFFLNYCTYGYTMPWWTWEQWQRFIDWMAMNGINRPLLQAGTEAAWLDVWKSYGLPEDQIRLYFGGPAHLPWHRMANHDKWGGPLPRSYIDGQMALQKQIVARARELGMRPILSAFAGHVPELLKTVRPEAKITQIAPGWGGMDRSNATWFLAPNEPLFQEIQGKFLKRQAELYGTDHLYGTDPFNEMSPPSWEPDYLAAVARAIYGSMAAADPGAVWYQMSWTFYYGHNWTPPRLAAMTHAVPQGKLVYLDYVCEEGEFYKKSQNFYGAPFLWCYLANFGGNTQLVAPLHKLSARLTPALTVPNCVGVGSTLEGLNVNPIAYDLLLEQPWHPGARVDLDAWVADYAARRAGRADPAVAAAWKILANKVLLDNGVGIWGHGVALQSRPAIKGGHGWTNPSIPYKNSDLAAAVEQMLAADPACRQADGYRFDVVNLTRQVVGNYSLELHGEMLKALADKDLPAFRQVSGRFLELGRDLDALLATRHEFLLGKWLADARAWGKDAAEADDYERNARQIISTWHKPGGSLTDYSNRQWNGMLATYYLPRWEAFIQQAEAALAAGRGFDQQAYDQWRVKFEGDWAGTVGTAFPATPQGDAYEAASRLFAKYHHELIRPPIPVKLEKAAWSQAVLPGTGRIRWTCDASAQMARPGTYRLEFKYTAGESAMTIARVALVQDGRELAVDEHDGWTGYENRQNAYLLKAETLVPGRPTLLVMDVQPASSTNSSGTIDIQAVP